MNDKEKNERNIKYVPLFHHQKVEVLLTLCERQRERGEKDGRKEGKKDQLNKFYCSRFIFSYPIYN